MTPTPQERVSRGLIELQRELDAISIDINRVPLSTTQFMLGRAADHLMSIRMLAGQEGSSADPSGNTP